MKTRFLIFLAILFVSPGVHAQPPETNYLGTVVVSGYTDDAYYGPYNIGFDFYYWETKYTQFYINSNGQVIFSLYTPAETYMLTGENVAIPSASDPDNFIAPFWDDLVVDSYGKILYTTIGASPTRKLVIQYKNMGCYDYPSTLGTFQVILYETSNIIQLQYRLITLPNSARGTGGEATIGIENPAGTDGIQYSFNTSSSVTSSQAISFTPAAGPSYTVNSGAVYDGIYLTTNLVLPDPGITTLISPPQNAVIGEDYTFQWGASSYASSYTLYISTHPELIGATTYSAGANLSYDITGLTLDETYYWGVFASNATGTTWCEIKKFTTSSAPPLVPSPQTIWTEQGEDKTIDLGYTGGGVNPKTAKITSLPVQGTLYQYNAGTIGDEITSVPTNVTDADMKVIYAASGTAGNGVGNFDFLVNEDPGGDSDEATITINVSPPGVPNVIYVAKSTNVEIQFDIAMADPAGKHNQFTVTVNGSPAAPNSAALKTGDVYTIVLTLATPLTGTETVYVAYTQGDVRGATGGYLFSFTNTLVTLLAQTIDLTLDDNIKYRTNYITLPTTSPGGLTVTYSSSNPDVASVSTNRLYLHALGSFTLTGLQGGNATYAPVRRVKPYTVIKGDQTITFAALSAKTYGAADFNLSATASSGLTVTFAGNNDAVATVTGTLVHIVGGGSVVITASQAGNSLWNAATDVPRTQTVNKTTLTATADDKSRDYGEENPVFTINYSGFVNSEDISVIDVVPTATSTATPSTNVGTVPITVSGGSDNSYSFAYVSGTLTINKADQTITFDPLPDKETDDPDFDPGATASSGLTVSYSSDNLLVATIVSDMIHIVDAGTSNITASQSGNTNYNAASDVIQPLTVSVATGLENPVSSSKSFIIYPANNLINIQTLDNEWSGQQNSVRVFNIIGNPVNDLQNVELTRNSLVQIPSPAVKGLYVVEIRSGVRRYVGKVVVR